MDREAFEEFVDAIKKDDLTLVKRMVLDNVDIINARINGVHMSPLEFAFSYASVEMVKFLLDHGADPKSLELLNYYMQGVWLVSHEKFLLVVNHHTLPQDAAGFVLACMETCNSLREGAEETERERELIPILLKRLSKEELEI